MRRLCFVALVLGGLTVGPASADFFSVHYDYRYDQINWVGVTLDYGTHELAAGGAGLLGADYRLGEYHSYDGSSDWVAFPNGYCLTPDQYIGSPADPWKGQFEDLTTNDKLYGDSRALTADEANRIAWLANIDLTATGYVAATADLDKIQRAIWMEIGVTGPGSSALLDSGTFTGSVLTLSDGTYTYDSTKNYGYSYLRAYTWSGQGIQGQDLIQGAYNQAGPQGGTPEPVTMSLCAAGLGLALIRRRRNR